MINVIIIKTRVHPRQTLVIIAHLS